MREIGTVDLAGSFPIIKRGDSFKFGVLESECHAAASGKEIDEF